MSIRFRSGFFRYFGVFLLGAGLLLSGCGPDDPGKAAARRVSVKNFYASLHVMQKSFPPSGLKLCHDDTLWLGLKSKSGRIISISFSFIDYLMSGEKPEDYKRWRFLNGIGVRSLKPLKELQHLSNLNAVLWKKKQIEKNTYLVLIRLTDKSWPLFTSTGKLKSGRVQGMLAVVDTRTSLPVCWAPFRAKNSDNFKPRGAKGKNSQRAAGQNLKKNTKAALKQALGKISKTVKIQLY